MEKPIKRGLKDRMYEKRKVAAQELVMIVAECLNTDNRSQIQQIIDQLAREFAYDVNEPHSRYGGLIGLAAVTLALGQNEIPHYLDSIINPVLACFGDHDANVRYYACEALYNISKVAKGEILLYFNDIFDILCKVVADPDHSVRNAAKIVDTLMKDIINEKATTYVSVLQLQKSEPQTMARVLDKSGKLLQFYDSQTPKAFQISKFIPLLKERIYTTNTFTRMFIVNWLLLLHSIPDLELISFLPSFLEPLLSYLSSSMKDVRVLTENFLRLLLQEINRIYEIKQIVQNNNENDQYIPGQDTSIDFSKIIDILVNNLESIEDLIRIISLEWLSNLLTISPESFTFLIPKLLAILLHIISDDNSELQNMAMDFNFRLMTLVSSNDNETNFSLLIGKLVSHLSDDKHSNKLTRLTSLDWLIMLQKKNHIQFINNSNNTFVTLLKSLNDTSEQVINKDLELLSKIADESDDDYFQGFMNDLLKMFKKDRNLLDTKGDFILRRLYQPLNPVRVYKSISLALYENEDNLSFVTIMIQILNNNLIVAPELANLRRKLISNESNDLFKILFKCWSLNSPSLLSLTLLTSNYKIAYQIIIGMSNYEINLGIFIQLDLLIQLLESPAFSKLRLDLLKPRENVYLYHCLYGLLMLLPQSNSFKILQNRLSSISPIIKLPIEEGTPNKLNTINENKNKNEPGEFLKWFNKSQERLMEFHNDDNNLNNLQKSMNDLSVNDEYTDNQGALSKTPNESFVINNRIKPKSYAELFPSTSQQQSDSSTQLESLNVRSTSVGLEENDEPLETSSQFNV